MKAVFMTEVGGRLMEIERRDIPKMLVYYVPVMEPIQARVFAEREDMAQPITPKREKWTARSKPVTDDDFAVFMLEGIE